MKTLSAKEFIKRLEVRGWVLKRINNSHNVFPKTGKMKIISVLVHGNANLNKARLQRKLMAIAEITDAEL